MELFFCFYDLPRILVENLLYLLSKQAVKHFNRRKGAFDGFAITESNCICSPGTCSASRLIRLVHEDGCVYSCAASYKHTQQPCTGLVLPGPTKNVLNKAY